MAETADTQFKTHEDVYGLRTSRKSPGPGPSTVFAVERVHASLRQSSVAGPAPNNRIRV